MNERVNYLVYLLAGMFEQVVKAKLNQHRRLYKDGRWHEHPMFPYFTLGIQQIEATDYTGNLEHYYTVCARTRTTKYPVDVMDFVVCDELIQVRYSGIELPICAVDGTMIISPEQFNRIFTVAIESNLDLMEALKNHKGGPHEAKSTGK
ncbi:hypothetical protein OBP_044 [Pseudomonas phage OBP]|uniref:hypothetical protein n=1 Tax=Pseudomonas phage OBP TaxID=1124849 RepID=UPI000240D629|nr:hypothetical protein OBP_044 [Pseudomonas phage OBP]AEV89481.1 hypothetical protein OBP_044 [Pseudomonas phage OBP]